MRSGRGSSTPSNTAAPAGSCASRPEDVDAAHVAGEHAGGALRVATARPLGDEDDADPRDVAVRADEGRLQRGQALAGVHDAADVRPQDAAPRRSARCSTGRCGDCGDTRPQSTRTSRSAVRANASARFVHRCPAAPA